MRSTVTCTLPLLASHGTDDSPPKVADAAPVKPFSSPTMATARTAERSAAAEIAVVPTWPEVETIEPVRSAYVRKTHQLPVASQLLPLWVRSPVRLGVRQQTQLPRMALAYLDWARRATCQADCPALCWSRGPNSFADSGMGAMPLDARSPLIARATATGSSPSPSRWLVISPGSARAALTCASHVCHSPAFCCGVKAIDGPTIVAPGAMRRISRTPVSHIWKYCALFMPRAQKTEMSGSFQTS